MMFIQRAK